MSIVLVGQLVLGLAFAAAGTLIARGGGHRPGSATALVGVLLLAGTAVTAAGAPAWGDALWALAVLVALPVTLLLHPDGAPPGPGGRTLLGLVAATGLLALVDPVGFRATEVTPVVLAVLVIAGLWWRHEHAGDRERRALLWLLLGLGVTTLVALPVEFLLGGGTAHAVAVTPAWLATPLALVVGARYPDRVDVRALIVRAVVFAVAALTFVAVFVGAASVIELTGGSASVGALAVIGAVCAAGFGPLARLLRGAVDRMLFGDRDAPIAAASRVGRQLADDPVPALRALRSSSRSPMRRSSGTGRWSPHRARSRKRCVGWHCVRGSGPRDSWWSGCGRVRPHWTRPTRRRWPSSPLRSHRPCSRANSPGSCRTPEPN